MKADEDEPAECPWWAIAPDSTLIRVWEWIILAAVLYSVSSAPYTAAFVSVTCDLNDPVAILLLQLSTACQSGGDYSVLVTSHPELTQGWATETAGYNTALPCASSVFGFCNIISDCAFVMDIAVNFITGYVPRRQTVPVYDLRKIARAYLGGSFWVDAVATFPWEAVVRAVLAREWLGLRLIGLVRMIRLVRIQKKISSYMTSPIVHLGSLVAAYLLCAHLLACLLFFVGRWQALDLLNGTEKDYAGDPWTVYTCMQFANSATQYSVSLYWAVTTITTVGYGDIVPITNTDKTVVMLAMFCSGVLQAVFLANFALIIEGIYSRSAKLSQRLEEVTAALRFYGVPKDLQQRVMDSVEYYWTQRYGVHDRAVLKQFSKRLQSEVAEEVLDCVYNGPEALTILTDDVMHALALHWTMKTCPPGETLLHADAGEPVMDVMHIRNGSCSIRTGGMTLDSVEAGHVVGHLDALLGMPCGADVVSSTYCTLYTLPTATLLDALDERPDDRKLIMGRAQAQYERSQRSAVTKICDAQRRSDAVSPSSQGPAAPAWKAQPAAPSDSQARGPHSDVADITADLEKRWQAPSAVECGGTETSLSRGPSNNGNLQESPFEVASTSGWHLHETVPDASDAGQHAPRKRSKGRITWVAGHEGKLESKRQRDVQQMGREVDNMLQRLKVAEMATSAAYLGATRSGTSRAHDVLLPSTVQSSSDEQCGLHVAGS